MGLDGHKGLQDPSQVAFDSLILCYMTPQGAGGLLALLWVGGLRRWGIGAGCVGLLRLGLGLRCRHLGSF